MATAAHHNRSSRTPQAGITTILVIGFMGIFMLVLGSVTSYAFQQAKFGRALFAREQAIHIAEAGLEYYRWYLAHNPSVMVSGSGLVSPYAYAVSDPEGGAVGSATVTATPNIQCGAVQWMDLTSVGRSNAGVGFPRTLAARYMRPSVAEYSYIVGGNVWAGSDRDIKGPYHSNGGVIMDATSNADVTSSVSTWWCDSAFSSSQCPSGADKPGVWGDGSGDVLWKYPVSTIDFAGMGVDLANLKTKVQTGGGIYYGPASGSANSRGYHLIFNSNGTVTVKRVTQTTAVYGYSQQGGVYAYRLEYNIITAGYETTLGTYAIPSTCSVIYTEDRTWIEGVVKGKVTVAASTPSDTGSAPDIILRNNITYASGPDTDGLTAIAEGSILIPLDSPNYMEIHGIFIAQNGRYARNAYTTSGSKAVPPEYRTTAYITPAQLTTVGTVVSLERTGTAWMNNGVVASGYQNRYDYYDRVLAFSPPPFTSATSVDYRLALWREQ